MCQIQITFETIHDKLILHSRLLHELHLTRSIYWLLQNKEKWPLFKMQYFWSAKGRGLLTTSATKPAGHLKINTYSQT